MKQVAVVIPFYKNILTEMEKISLKQCFKILGSYPIIAIKPFKLDLSFLEGQVVFSEIISFDNNFFENIKGYNGLMLSPSFYEIFLQYEYILVYQLDAFVFSDQLTYWCQQNYDYIGAPWLVPANNLFNYTILSIKGHIYRKFDIRKKGVPKNNQLNNAVGNGGFSLRKVKVLHQLSLKFKDLATEYIAKERQEFNEDVFWSIAMPYNKQHINIPHYKIALKFSFERNPDLAFKMNKGRLPFGCHAWDKELKFWRDKSAFIDYEL